MEPDSDGNNPIHHAATADTPEVVAFLVEQVRVLFPPLSRLLNKKNNAGETPLLRAAAAGKFACIRYLLEEDADPYTVDQNGQNILMALAKHNHLWCLHCTFSLLYERVGHDNALQLMSAVDGAGHTVLDWAAGAAGVNVLDYLIRLGSNPSKLDSSGRSALYWAVAAQRVAAARFLVKCGCDPLEEDNTRRSPLQLAKDANHSELIKVLQEKPPSDSADRHRPQLFTVDRRGHKIHHALPMQRRWPNVLYILLYGMVVYFYWMLMVYIAYFVWIPFFVLSAAFYW
jgi:ankyrin repeat protein